MIPVKSLAVGVVGAGCIAAAGLGGYLAVRGGSAHPAAAPAELQTLSAESQPAKAADDSAAERPFVENLVRPAPTEQEAARKVEPRASSASAGRPVTRPSTPPTPPSEPAPASAPAAPAARESASSVSEPEPARSAAQPEPAAPTATAHDSTPVIVEPPKPSFEVITVEENSVIGIRLETPISSETAKVEDRVTARVTRDVTVDGRVAVPSGATLEGIVTTVERGGRFRERARIGIEFRTVVLPDQARVAIETETIYRQGDAPTGEATAKIGGAAVVGSILGAVIGGKKGAAIGGGAGAAGGTAAVMASGPNHVALATGTALTVRLTESATFQVPIEP